MTTHNLAYSKRILFFSLRMHSANLSAYSLHFACMHAFCIILAPLPTSQPLFFLTRTRRNDPSHSCLFTVVCMSTTSGTQCFDLALSPPLLPLLIKLSCSRFLLRGRIAVVGYSPPWRDSQRVSSQTSSAL